LSIPFFSKLAHARHAPAFLAMTALGLGCAIAPAFSRSLQIAGSAGYLSEWEFTGAAAETNAADGNEYGGPLNWKHVGLCSVNGPQEKPGAIRFRLSRLGSLSHIDATISFDGAQCIYRGDLSDNFSGQMDCTNAKGVPLSLSIK
jgi:hypothetical protein